MFFTRRKLERHARSLCQTASPISIGVPRDGVLPVTVGAMYCTRCCSTAQSLFVPHNTLAYPVAASSAASLEESDTAYFNARKLYGRTVRPRLPLRIAKHGGIPLESEAIMQTPILEDTHFFVREEIL